MAKLKIALPNSLETSPYRSLADSEKIDLIETTALNSIALFETRSVDWALLPVDYLLNHGELITIPYGIVYYHRPSKPLADQLYFDSELTDNFPFVAAIWTTTKKGFEKSRSISLEELLEFGISTAITRARDWASTNNLSEVDATNFITLDIGHRIDQDARSSIASRFVNTPKIPLSISEKIDSAISVIKQGENITEIGNFIVANSHKTTTQEETDELLQRLKEKGERISLAQALSFFNPTISIAALALAAENSCAKIYSEATAPAESLNSLVKIDLTKLNTPELLLYELLKLRLFQDQSMELSAAKIFCGAADTPIHSQLLLRSIYILQLFLDNFEVIAIDKSCASDSFVELVSNY